MPHFFRLRVNWTYSTTNSATTATTNINNALAAAGRSETATRNGSTVDLIVEPIETEAEAISLRNALTSSWATGTRTTGKASLVRRDEGSP